MKMLNLKSSGKKHAGNVEHYKNINSNNNINRGTRRNTGQNHKKILAAKS